MDPIGWAELSQKVAYFFESQSQTRNLDESVDSASNEAGGSSVVGTDDVVAERAISLAGGRVGVLKWLVETRRGAQTGISVCARKTFSLESVMEYFLELLRN